MKTQSSSCPFCPGCPGPGYQLRVRDISFPTLSYLRPPRLQPRPTPTAPSGNHLCIHKLVQPPPTHHNFPHGEFPLFLPNAATQFWVFPWIPIRGPSDAVCRDCAGGKPWGWCILQKSAVNSFHFTTITKNDCSCKGNKCFMFLISLNPRTIQRDGNKGPCFTDEEMEPQRGKMTCPRSQ